MTLAQHALAVALHERAIYRSMSLAAILFLLAFAVLVLAAVALDRS